MKKQIKKLGFLICSFCLSFFVAAYSHCICITFLANQNFPKMNSRQLFI